MSIAIRFSGAALQMVDKSKLAIATSQIQNPIPFKVELLFNLLSQMITISTIKLTSQPVSLDRL